MTGVGAALYGHTNVLSFSCRFMRAKIFTGKFIVLDVRYFVIIFSMLHKKVHIRNFLANVPGLFNINQVSCIRTQRYTHNAPDPRCQKRIIRANIQPKCKGREA